MKHLPIAAVVLAASFALNANAATPPSYPEGEDALYAKIAQMIVYPDIAMENGIEGRVIVKAVVMPDGSLTNIRPARPLDPALEAEAVRVVGKLPLWNPALDDNGNPVESEVLIPVKFRL